MDDNTIECPHCGALVFYELTRCLECGKSFYPLDEQDDEETQPAGEHAWLRAIAAIVTGWIVAGAIAFSMHFLVGLFFAVGELTTAGRILLLLAIPLSSLVGGYLAGAQGKSRAPWLGPLSGLAVGLLNLPILALLEARWQEVTLNYLLQAGPLLCSVVSALAGLTGGFLQQKRQPQPGASFEAEYRLYQDLLAKVRYDREAADRLIEYERRRQPTAERSTLVKSAIQRWERDNR